jgi:hypothetical protein
MWSHRPAAHNLPGPRTPPVTTTTGGVFASLSRAALGVSQRISKPETVTPWLNSESGVYFSSLLGDVLGRRCLLSAASAVLRLPGATDMTGRRLFTDRICFASEGWTTSPRNTLSLWERALPTFAPTFGNHLSPAHRNERGFFLAVSTTLARRTWTGNRALSYTP